MFIKKFLKHNVMISLVLCLGLSGCVSKKEEAVVEAIQAQLKADTYTIEHNISGNTSTGSVKTVELDFIGVDKTKENDVSASKAAYYFFKNISQEDVKYSRVKIILENDISKFTRIYTKDNIQKMDSIL